MIWRVAGMVACLGALLPLGSCFTHVPMDVGLSWRIPDDRNWAPPAWYPAPESIGVLSQMEGEATGRVPGLSSRAVFVFDIDSGEVLFARSPDDRRPVASLTKLTSSLAMASEAPDLERELCVDMQFWPSRPGARSAFSTGHCYRGWDFLGAALVASDNRGAYGLQVVSGLGFDGFIERMNEVSEELGMRQSTWADPSGLEDENLSTARDMARAAVAVAFHPDLAMAATAPQWRLERTDAVKNRVLFTTDRLVGRDDVTVLAGKTGYTDTAGYCFAGVIEKANGQRLALAVLGAARSRDRWRDVERILAQ